MKGLKNSFISRFAAAALAVGVLSGPAFAQDAPETDSLITDPVETVVQDVEQTAAENQGEVSTEWKIVTEPRIPMEAIYGLGGLLLLLTAWGASRKVKGSFMYAAAGGALLVTLANPQILEEEREALPTEIAIVIDKSDSQGLDGRDETTQAMYDALLGRLGNIDDINIRTINVEDAAGTIDTDGSRVISAMEEGIADIPRDRLGAVILLSDGQVHDADEWNNALGDDVPLHVMISGHNDEKDRRIQIEDAPRFGLIDEEQTITFKVIDNGDLETDASGRVRVSINVDGEDIGERFVIPGQSTDITVELAHAGTNTISLTADIAEGEMTDANNRIVTSIEGLREDLNVLLVTGDPNQGTRVWRDLLKSDPDINMVHFSILRSPEDVDYTPSEEMSLIAFPTHELFTDRINDFDLIIFDTYEYRGLISYFNNISRYVEDGGALLVVSGPELASPLSIANTPLGRVLPGTPTGNSSEATYRPDITETGDRHPVTRGLDDTPDTPPEWGRWSTQVEVTNDGGDVLMSGNAGAPLLILEREGEGRVAMITSNNTWAWARGIDGGGPHAELMSHIAHWLLANPALEEEDIRFIQRDNELILEHQTLGDESSPVTINTPDGDTIEVTPEEVSPGIWRARVPISGPGLYSAEIEGTHPDEAYITIGAGNSRELENTTSTENILEPLASQTGGRTARMFEDGERTNGTTGNLDVPRVEAISADDADASGPNWIGIRMTDASVLKGVEKDPAIPPWLGLLVSMGLLAGAYYSSGGRKLFGGKDKDNNSGPDQNGRKQPKPSV